MSNWLGDNVMLVIPNSIFCNHVLTKSTLYNCQQIDNGEYYEVIYGSYEKERGSLAQ